MDRVGVEISDVGILAASGTPPSLLPIDGMSRESPGYAVSQSKELVIGTAALEVARLHPREVKNRFWAHLSTHPLAEKTAAAGNYAEMAFAHIRLVQMTLAKPGVPWVIATPGFMDEGRLGILLGILKELEIPVRGLVSLPVAACRPNAAVRRMVHLDLHLHGAEMTELLLDGDMHIGKTHTVSNVGWDELLEAIGKGVADEFVRATRFDPLHHADCEQELHTALLGLIWRKTPIERETIELSARHGAHSLTIHSQMLVDPTDELRAPVADALERMVGNDPECILQVSHRAGMVPGLLDEVQGRVPCTVTPLPIGAAATGVLSLGEAMFQPGEDEDGGVAFITRRPLEASDIAPTSQVVPPLPMVADAPTHVLYRDRAIAIGPIPIPVGRSLQDEVGIELETDEEGIGACHVHLLREGDKVYLECVDGNCVTVDGQTVDERCVLQMGQTVSFGVPGQELLLIRVESDHGT